MGEKKPTTKEMFQSATANSHTNVELSTLV